VNSREPEYTKLSIYQLNDLQDKEQIKGMTRT